MLVMEHDMLVMEVTRIRYNFILDGPKKNAIKLFIFLKDLFYN